MYRKSPRWVEPTVARSIIAGLPPFVLAVGVFVNEDAERVRALTDECGFALAQLHGDESKQNNDGLMSIQSVLLAWLMSMPPYLRALIAFSDLQIHGGVLQVEQKVIAFSLAEYITNEMLLIHVEKALNGYKGAYAMINQQMLRHCQLLPFVNREEDLGLDNLTKVKQSYHPLHLEKKFFCQV